MSFFTVREHFRCNELYLLYSTLQTNPVYQSFAYATTVVEQDSRSSCLGPGPFSLEFASSLAIFCEQNCFNLTSGRRQRLFDQEERQILLFQIEFSDAELSN